MDHYRLGRVKLDENDIPSARRHFQDGAAAGDPRCTYGLVALAAKAGEPMDRPLDRLQARIPQIQAMAEDQDADACFIMGRCCETGSAVPHNLPAAITWYIQAASYGNADAMFNLGCIYMKLDPDAERLALDQFRRAAERGCEDAKLALDHYYRYHPQI